MQKALALLLSAAMLLCLHPAAAQQPNTLTGTVTDSASGKAVGYATVSLQRDSVTVVNAVAANSDGRFSLKAPETGDYQLCITMVGYTPYKQAVEVPASGKALGKIAITQGVEVGDVVIEVQKPLVMADAEKTTRSLYFRVSYRFGKQNVGVKRTAKSIRNDDMSSGAQGGGGGSTGGAQGGGGM